MAHTISCSTSVLRLMEPQVSPIPDAVLYAILSGDNISNSVANIVLGGMAMEIENLRRYAKNTYTLGLPQGSTSTIFTAPVADIESAIADALSLPLGVEVDTYFSDPLTVYYILLPFLTADRGYNVNNAKISIFPAGLELPLISSTGADAINAVFLHTLDLDQTDQVTVTITYGILTSYLDDNLELQTDDLAYFEEEQVISSAYQVGGQYYIASYYELDSGGVKTGDLKWWFYKIATDVYSALDGTPVPEIESMFLPVVPIRHNNLDLTREAVQETELYLTSKKLLKKASMDIDDLADKLNENPNIEDIDHAYVMFGISLETESNIGIWYLGEFFDFLSRGAAVNQWDYMNDMLNYHPPAVQSYTRNTFNTVMAGGITASEYGFNIKIDFPAITTTFSAGSIGEIGTATKVLHHNTAGGEEIEANDNGWMRYVSFPSNAKVVFTLQVSTNVIKTITVYDPIHQNYVYRTHSVRTRIDNLYFDKIKYGEPNNNFIIPIHYGVAHQMDRIQQNALYEESLSIVINSYEKNDVAWYETDWFRFIIKAIGFILSFVGSIGTFLTKLVGALLQPSVWVLVQFIVLKLVYSVVLSMVFKLIASAVGPEFAIILGVILAIYSIAGKSSMGKTSFLGTDMPTADLLMTFSNALVGGAQEAVAEEIIEIGEDIVKLKDESTARFKRLEEMEELLNPENPLPELLLTQNAALTEHPLSSEPSKFYDLMCHMGNIGTVTIHDVIPEYVNMALYLENTDETSFTNNILSVS
jgi:hypothetical protein